MSAVELDLRYRIERLSKMKLLPKIYGQEFSGIFKQRYHGHVTVVPQLTWKEAFGVSAIQNPTVRDMQHYLLDGARAVWPLMQKMRLLLQVEIWCDMMSLSMMLTW